MKGDMPVSEIMTKSVITVHAKDDLRKVSGILKKNKIRHVPVVEHDKLVGIVSLTDLLRLSFADVYETDVDVDDAVFDMLTLDQVMVHTPKTIKATDTIQEAARILSESEFHALPVVERGRVAGIVTTTDIIKYFLKHLEDQ